MQKQCFGLTNLPDDHDKDNDGVDGDDVDNVVGGEDEVGELTKAVLVCRRKGGGVGGVEVETGGQKLLLPVGKLPSKTHYCVLYSPDYTQFQCFSRARHHDDKIKWVKQPG